MFHIQIESIKREIPFFCSTSTLVLYFSSALSNRKKKISSIVILRCWGSSWWHWIWLSYGWLISRWTCVLYKARSRPRKNNNNRVAKGLLLSRGSIGHDSNLYTFNDDGNAYYKYELCVRGKTAIYSLYNAIFFFIF